EGKLIGRIRLPEVCGNVCFGGPKRNRLCMAASQSLYALYVSTQGAAPGSNRGRSGKELGRSLSSPKGWLESGAASRRRTVSFTDTYLTHDLAPQGDAVVTIRVGSKLRS